MVNEKYIADVTVVEVTDRWVNVVAKDGQP